MAHSYIQAHESELRAFRAFVELYPDAVLLVDTYDSLEGVRNVIRLSKELGDASRIRAIRLDSGDLSELAMKSRALLDSAGLEAVEIFASGGLDEYEITRLVENGAPITGFGVGMGMGVAADAPALDIAYKLTSYAGRGRTKLSPDKEIVPGRKQVFRVEIGESAIRDVIGTADEVGAGRALLHKVMDGGVRTKHGSVRLEESRVRAAEEVSRLPERIQDLAATKPPFSVWFSEQLDTQRSSVTDWVKNR
jgi:nicotinate phosphoribosyltransferase